MISRQYKYKMQWLFKDKKKVFKIIDIIGIRFFDVMNFRDINLKIIDQYSGFIQYSYGVAEDETKKYIKKALKNNKDIFYTELLRR